MRKSLSLFAVVLWISAPFAYADESTEMEITQLIIDTNAEVRENLKGEANTVAEDGSLEFWSSGGLLQEVAPSSEEVEYEAFTIVPKHIRIVTLVPGEVAVAQYYAEGSMHPKGGKPVANYRTRATQVYVKEGGEWKIRAAHWSPIAGGGGTSQTSVDD